MPEPQISEDLTDKSGFNDAQHLTFMPVLIFNAKAAANQLRPLR
jgi:hypothetical protein